MHQHLLQGSALEHPRTVPSAMVTNDKGVHRKKSAQQREDGSGPERALLGRRTHWVASCSSDQILDRLRRGGELLAYDRL